MALFDTTEPQKNFFASASEDEKIQEVKWSGKEETMAQAIGKLRKGKVIHFITCGCWSCYELLKYLLKQTGPAEVEAFTWNISMPAVTQILKMQSDGLITNFRILVHSAMKKYTAEAISVIQSKVDKVVLYQNHAKGFLIKNENFEVSVITSANFSNNVNIEAGVITCSTEVWKMHKKWLERFFSDSELDSSNTIIDQKILEEKKNPQKHLYIVRGLPGSGKTTFAKSFADSVFSNDDYFYSIDGTYKFDRGKMPRAKAECYSRVRQAMEDGVQKIAVANVFAEEEQIKEYKSLSEIYGYQTHVIICENRHNGHNIHQVEAETITSMRKKFKISL